MPWGMREVIVLGDKREGEFGLAGRAVDGEPDVVGVLIDEDIGEGFATDNHVGGDTLDTSRVFVFAGYALGYGTVPVKRNVSLDNLDIKEEGRT